MPFISFIVPLFNHLEHTQKMLKSLIDSISPQLDYEVILVDDGSTDDTRQWINSLTSERIHVVLNESNLGYAKANNIGVGRARGQWICLLNNDLLFESGWLEPMLEIIQNPPLSIGVVGNLQYRMSDGALDHAGMSITSDGKFCHRTEIELSASNGYQVLALTGACLLLSRADYLDVGGLDEAFVNGCEDVDLCFKLASRHQYPYLCTSSKIRHYVSLSRSENGLQNDRNSQLLFSKWRSQIKFELKKIWLLFLGRQQGDLEGYVDGSLSDAFLAAPQTAAGMMADWTLLGLESYWQHKFDGDTLGMRQIKCSAKGLIYDSVKALYCPQPTFELAFEQLPVARNVFICGKRDKSLASEKLIFEIIVNDIQIKRCELLDAANFNIGIIHPILFRQGPNVLKVKISGASVPNDGSGFVPGLGISHLIVDDQKVSVL